VQFSNDWTPAIVVGSVISIAQFVIGNVIQPRIMADSLNLSAIVVLLSLALWGFLWGIAGAFLSAPLTVALMIVLAQFPSTRWLAILLSTNNHPEDAGDGKSV
jgi:predicted PurR-regulated permease PerM